MFLASGLVPAYTAAAFAKRFARLALTASPAGVPRRLLLLFSCMGMLACTAATLPWPL